MNLEELSYIARILFESNHSDHTDAWRRQVCTRLAELRLRSAQLYAGSLTPSAGDSSVFYLTADLRRPGGEQPVLLRFAPQEREARERFRLLSPPVRLDLPQNRPAIVEAISFSSSDYANILEFVLQEGRCFLPRPQRRLPAIAAGNRHPEISLPAAFEAYGHILEERGVNMASTVQLSASREMTTDSALLARSGEDPVVPGHTRVSIRHLYHAGLWAAVRSGWREGYTAEADHIIVSGASPEEIARSIEEAKEAIRHAAGYTKFTTDTSRLFELRADPRHPRAWSDPEVMSRFEEMFSAEERLWILSEFTRTFSVDGREYSLDRAMVVRLAVKFGPSLKLNEDLYDWIAQVKAAGPGSPEFDFEPSLDEAETLTTPEELLFAMHWLKARGRPAQLVPPNLGFKKRQAYPSALASSPEAGIGLQDYVHHKMWPELVPRVVEEFGGKPLAELSSRVRELAAVARSYDGTLSVHSGSGKQSEVLEVIGQATGGRVNYKISGELQLQLFDVLRGQPPGSYWRELYERMAARANEFARAGAFGPESELAAAYAGKGSYLGDSARGRVDGNLFLVFWVGNIVGSRDVAAPDGDHRFFKEKIDELPSELLREVRRRNRDYIVWLSRHLGG